MAAVLSFASINGGVKFIPTGNDYILTLSGLSDEDGFVGSAAVTVQITTVGGVNVGNSITASFLPLSDGDYEALMKKDLGLADGASYIADITVNAGTNRRARIKWRFVALERGS